MKKTILALMLALALVLSGCSLVVKDPAVDAKQVILDINGETVDKQTVSNAFNSLLNQEYQMQQMYQMYGMQAPPIDEDALLEQAKDASIRRVILKQQAAQQGIDQLDDAAKAELTVKQDEEWKNTLDWVKQNYLPNTELTGEELEHEIEHTAEDLGITRQAADDAVLEQFVSDKLEQAATQDVTVPDADVQADFDAKVEANKTAYTDDPNTYGNAVNGGTTVYWAPAGYRMIKQVLIKFLPEDQQKIDAKQAEKSPADEALAAAQAAVTQNEQELKGEGLSEEDKKALEEKTSALVAAVTEAQQKVDQLAAELEALKQAGYAAILPKAQEVVTRAQTEPFDTLVSELNEDTGMPAAGYAVREGFTSFDEAFVGPAMALAAVGDVAQPSPGIYGYYVVQYAADVPEGPVAFDSVKTALHDALLQTKKTEAWDAAVQGWTDAAQIQEHMDRMTN